MVKMFKDWITKLRNPNLTRKISIAEVEATSRIWIPPPLWEAFKGKTIRGTNSGSSQPHPNLADADGRAGIALVRKGRAIDWIVTALN